MSVGKLRHLYVLNVFPLCFCDTYWQIIHLNKVSFDIQKLGGDLLFCSHLHFMKSRGWGMFIREGAFIRRNTVHLIN